MTRRLHDELRVPLLSELLKVLAKSAHRDGRSRGAASTPFRGWHVSENRQRLHKKNKKIETNKKKGIQRPASLTARLYPSYI